MKLKICLSSEDIGISKSERQDLQELSGLKRRTAASSIHSLYTNASFLAHTMHNYMNIYHGFIDTFKCNCVHLAGISNEDGYLSITASIWRSIDCTMHTIRSGTCPNLFPDIAANTTYYKSWKAVGCQEVLRNYARIVSDEILPRQYLRNLLLLYQLVALSSRPALSYESVGNLRRLGFEFVPSFEALFYKFDPKTWEFVNL